MGGDMGAGYGTRSRNRGGRINYAEDKDIDMDVYDYYDKKDQDVPKKSSRKSDVAANGGDGAPRAVGSRRAAAEEAKAVVTSNQNGFKQTTTSGVVGGAIAGAGAGAGGAGAGAVGSASQGAPTSGAVQATRKRKAAATTTVSTKKAGQTSQIDGAAWPETNMLTFDNCNHRPDANGRMVADDGTVLEPNGECFSEWQ